VREIEREREKEKVTVTQRRRQDSGEKEDTEGNKETVREIRR